MDPSVDETRRLAVSLRRSAKDERLLFHYNGHGVPRPTPAGELWVFNKAYTQYIPVSVLDLQAWLGSPCIYVYDCSAAGHILAAVDRFARASASAPTSLGSLSAADAASTDTISSHIEPNKEASDTNDTTTTHLTTTANIRSTPTSTSTPSTHNTNTTPKAATPDAAPNTMAGPAQKECIQLAACGPNEVLPMNPDLPADVFTCCLTTPIEIALRWFVTQNPLLTNVTPSMIMKIPGRLNDRRTPLGELNWIFTAITDTIAWNSLPHDLFKKLFRQDLMVAALFRNFLLADRIMRYYNCTPMSSPPLPQTHQHPMWAAWDLAADMCLSQLPALIAAEEGKGPPVEYKHSTFFAEQLTAFEVWLSKGHSSPHPPLKPPEQPPIVLQVLLSQVHRLRALMLLSRFLDMGPWAVNLALGVGIFPYVLKLLQSPAPELKPVLVFIWAKILAIDKSCQNDLLKDNGYAYFVSILNSDHSLPVLPNIAEHRAMCAFILSVFVSKKFVPGKEAVFKSNLLHGLVLRMADPDPLLRQWSALCLGVWWDDWPAGRAVFYQDHVHEKVLELLKDPVPEVRAASLYALTCLLGTTTSPSTASTTPSNPNLNLSASGGLASSAPGSNSSPNGLAPEDPSSSTLEPPKSEDLILLETTLVVRSLDCITDASPLVRKELVVLLSRFVHEYPAKFTVAAFECWDEDRKRNTAAGTGLGWSVHSSGGTFDERRSLSRKDKRPVPTLSSLSSSAAAATFTSNHHSHTLNDRKQHQDPQFPRAGTTHSVHTVLWQALLILSTDPVDAVKSWAERVVDGVNWGMMHSPVMETYLALDREKERERRGSAGIGIATATGSANRTGASSSGVSGVPESSSSSPANLVAGMIDFVKKDPRVAGSSPTTSVMSTLKRSASMAYSLRNLVTGNASGGLNTNGGGGLSSGSGPATMNPPLKSSPVNNSSVSFNGTLPGGAGLSYHYPSFSNVCVVDPVLNSVNSRSFNNLSARLQELEMALVSDFLDWSSEYFTEPQMKVPDEQDPGSLKFNQRKWRQQLNARVLEESTALWPVAAFRTFDDPITTLPDPTLITHLALHGYEDWILTSDVTDGLTLWDTRTSSRVSVWDNLNPATSKISSLGFINEQDLGLVYAGSSDGIIRVYRDVQTCPTLLTSFRVLPEVNRKFISYNHDLYTATAPHPAPALSLAAVGLKRDATPVLLEWQQSTASLFSAGQARIIKIWDMERELCVMVRLNLHILLLSTS